MPVLPDPRKRRRLLIDCHTHLDPFADDEVSQILDRARDVGVGVGCVICAGTTLESSRRSVRLSGLFPGVFSGVGIHPMDIREPVDEATHERLRQLAASSDKVVVISEIGLDFMEGTPDPAIQYQAFRQQIRLARDLKLAIVFHSREAHEEVLRVLREERAYEVGGAMHYFQGDERTARAAIDLGFYISLARPLLRLPYLQRVAAGLPLESIVLETDSAPQPFKAKRENWTEPRHLRPIAEKLAQLQGRDVEEVEAITTGNAQRMLAGKWDVVKRCISPNPPKDTDGRREDSGRGWVRELQGRWPGVLG